MENKFDKKVKDLMQKYPSELDLDKFWSNLEPKLPEKKKRRFLLWWLWIPFVIGSPLVIFFLNQKAIKESTIVKHHEHKSENVDIGQNSNFTEDQNHLESKLMEGQIKDTLDTEKAKTMQILSSVGLRNQANLSEPGQHQTNSQTLLQNKSADIEQNRTQNSKQKKGTYHIFKNVHDANNNNLQIQSEDQVKNSSKDKNENSLNEKDERKDIFEDGRHQLVSADKLVESEGLFIHFQDSNQNDILPETSNDTSDSINENLFELSDKPTEKFIESSKDSLLEDKAKSSMKGKSISFYLRPEMGVGGYFKNLVTSDDNLSMYVQERKKSESNLEEWIGSFYLGMQYRKWNLESGIQFLQRNEKFEYNQTKSSNNYGLTLADIEYSNGNRDSSYIEAWYINYKSRKVIHYNKIQQWNIPLNIGIDVLSVKNWSMGIQAGILFSISNQVKGRLLNDQLEISEIEDLKLSKVQKTLGIGFNTGIYTQYHLGERFSLVGAFQYQTFNASIFSGPIEQKYQSLQMKLGLQIKF
ncbi:MAG: hypothetical protein IPO62_07755 [Saprospiraceae bacterium]|nr:hypothetical protein [Saprospiraceae bacterium]